MSLTLATYHNAQSVVIDLPSYGYDVSVHMPICTTRDHAGAYKQYDPDSAGGYDYRVLEAPLFTLSKTQKANLNTFFRDEAVRDVDIYIQLGASPTGFFPFGPDKGDVGTFKVRLLNQEQGGMLQDPWKYFEDKLTMALITAQAYVLPTEIDEGGFVIGGVDGLLMPQEGFKPGIRYNEKTSLLKSGVASSLEGRLASDKFETEFIQQCNQTKAAALVNYLTSSSGRAAEVILVPEADYYVFGNDVAYAAGGYDCRFLGSSHTREETILTIKHERLNGFTIPLNFAYLQDA